MKTDKTHALWREHAADVERARRRREELYSTINPDSIRLVEQQEEIERLKEALRIKQQAFQAQVELVRDMQDTMAYVDLHISQYPIRKLTTEQKELWADAVDASNARADERENYDEPSVYRRWWREDYEGPWPRWSR